MKRLSEFKQSINESELIEEMADEDKRLAVLVRAGLYDAKKLNVLKRAMDKSAGEMTPAERTILIDLLHKLINVIDSNQALYSKVKQAVREGTLDEATTIKDPPALLIMRRKAIRMFPDGKRVVMYYIDKLSKYISIPYDEFGIAPANAIPVAEGLDKACWKGYEAVGMKKKNGKKVPNCVPVSEESDEWEYHHSSGNAKKNNRFKMQSGSDEAAAKRRAVEIDADARRVSGHTHHGVMSYDKVKVTKVNESKKMTSLEKLKKFDKLRADVGKKPIFKENEPKKQAVNEGVLRSLEAIANRGGSEFIRTSDGNQIRVDAATAKAILNVHNAVNDKNKKKIEDMLNKDEINFHKVAAFSSGAHTS